MGDYDDEQEEDGDDDDAWIMHVETRCVPVMPRGMYRDEGFLFLLLLLLFLFFL